MRCKKITFFWSTHKAWRPCTLQILKFCLPFYFHSNILIFLPLTYARTWELYSLQLFWEQPYDETRAVVLAQSCSRWQRDTACPWSLPQVASGSQRSCRREGLTKLCPVLTALQSHGSGSICRVAGWCKLRNPTPGDLQDDRACCPMCHTG